MKITGTQIGIAAILLWLLLRKKNTATQTPPNTPPVTNTPTIPRTNVTPPVVSNRRELPGRAAVAGEWEINCYHQVI